VGDDLSEALVDFGVRRFGVRGLGVHRFRVGGLAWRTWFSQIAGHAGVRKSQATLESQDLIEFVVRDGNKGFSDLAGDDADFAIGLEDFDEPFGMSDAVGPADYPVVREQDRVVILDEGEDGFREGLRTGSFKGSDGGWPDEDLVLRYVADWGDRAGERIGGCVGGVAVNNGPGWCGDDCRRRCCLPYRRGRCRQASCRAC
jgi:hypothetical protein